MTSALIDALRHMLLHEMDVELPVREIDQDTPLFEGGLDLDSFTVMELITLIEERLDLVFAEEDLEPENFATLASLEALLAAKLAAQGSRRCPAAADPGFCDRHRATRCRLLFAAFAGPTHSDSQADTRQRHTCHAACWYRAVP